MFASETFAARPIPAQAGVGLRLPHHAHVLQQRPNVPWLEVHSENYMADDAALAELEELRDTYSLSLHCVGLSLGSAAGVEPAHIERLRYLKNRLQPALISDHLSWSAVGGVYLPDLLPLPYTRTALTTVADNVDRVQQALGRRLLVENPSTYLQFAESHFTEPEFLAELVRRVDCGVLLDVNNVYVSAWNRSIDANECLREYFDAGLAQAIGEIHLAGHALVMLEDGATVRIDDHGSQVCDAVWDLYVHTVRRLGPRPTLIEWDTRLPTFETLQEEAARADVAMLEATADGNGNSTARHGRGQARDLLWENAPVRA